MSSTWTQKFSTRLLVSYNNKGQNDNLERIGGVGAEPELNVYLKTSPASGGTVSGNTLLGTLNNLASRSLTPAHKGTISLDANYYLSDVVGAHDLQAGVYLQPNAATWADTYYANDGFTTEDAVLRDPNNASAGHLPFHRRYVNFGTNGVRTSYIGADDYALYIQDRWAPTNRLSISPGLRVEWIAAQDKLFGVQTQASWNFAPRIGATYVLTADQKHVVRASWGRVTDIPNAGYFENVGSNVVASRDEYDLDLDGVFETIRETPASTLQSTNKTLDPDKHQGYVQEWITGYRTQLPGAVTIDASWVSRKYKDRPATVEINQIYEDNVWRGLVDPTQNSITLATNNQWNWFDYSGLEFTVTKQTPAFNVITTYTRAWRHLAGTWQPNDPAAIIQPDTFPNDGGVGTVRGSGANSYATDTRNRSWQNHQYPSRCHVACAVAAAGVDAADRAVGHPQRASRDDNRRAGSAVRADLDGDQRSHGVESAFDNDALCLCHQGRGAAVDAVAEDVERTYRPGVCTGQRSVRPDRLRRLQHPQLWRRPAVPWREQQHQRQLRAVSKHSNTAIGPDLGPHEVLEEKS